MPHSKKKKNKDAPEFDNRPARFEALAELTKSEIVQQVKDGISRIAPIEAGEEDSEEASR